MTFAALGRHANANGELPYAGDPLFVTIPTFIGAVPAGAVGAAIGMVVCTPAAPIVAIVSGDSGSLWLPFGCAFYGFYGFAHTAGRLFGAPFHLAAEALGMSPSVGQRPESAPPPRPPPQPRLDRCRSLTSGLTREELEKMFGPPRGRSIRNGDLWFRYSGDRVVAGGIEARVNDEGVVVELRCG